MDKSLKRQLNESIVELGGKPLINIGSCTRHILHKGFHAGLVSVDDNWGIDEFLSVIFSLFKKYPSRFEDLNKVQESLLMEKAFRRFLSNRWLSVYRARLLSRY